jgi:hypothetical protein
MTNGTRREVRCQCHAPAVLYPKEKSCTNCTGRWVSPRASLDRCGKSCDTGFWSPHRPACSQSLYQLSYPADDIITIDCIVYSSVRRLRKATSGFVSVCPSIRLSASSNSASSGRIFMKFSIHEGYLFSRNYVDKNQFSIESAKNKRYLYLKNCTHLWSYLAEFLKWRTSPIKF